MDQDRVWLAARLLLAKRGNDAPEVARRHAQEWIDRNDHAPASLWLEIADAAAVLRLSLSDNLVDTVAERLLSLASKHSRSNEVSVVALRPCGVIYLGIGDGGLRPSGSLPFVY